MAAVVVALVAAGISVYQAKIASSARQAAQEQAAAAQEQVAIMRADRDERDGPVFTVSAVDAQPEMDLWGIRVVLIMEQGKAMEAVAVRASGELLDEQLHPSTVPTHTSAGSWNTEPRFRNVRVGEEIVFYMTADDGYVGTKVAIDLECHELDGDRTWIRHYACVVARPPSPPPTSRRRFGAR